ncbi:MAG: phospho-sugar mutase [Erysipelotrichaceae bacterium]|nr:phospho-sugar mutase [Erysipelotrichaceae bacterium]
MLDEKTKKNYERWLASPRLSEEEKQALRSMKEEEISDSFFRDMEFGTGGMRGKLGLGTNRMNSYTVGRVTIAFGLYLLHRYPSAKKQGVVISHDNRYHSRDFALEAAHILNEEGIPAFLFDALRPTPELSYAVRKKRACGGIMITASHNPKEYNGYKIYDDTGCQLLPDDVNEMLRFLNQLPDELEAKAPKDPSPAATAILPPSIDDEYVKEVENCQLNPSLPKQGFKIIYSPQHGASYENAMRVFRDCGYEVIPVLSQCVHDPAFGATLSPNPETAESFIESIRLAQKEGADLCVMTDPDGDRCGVAYLSSKGTYERFTGNQSAALLIDYLFSERKEKGLLSSNGVMYDTIVTSDLGRKIAHAYGIKTESFLTGFKYIGNRIDYYEKLGHGPKFEFGYEESYGCLIRPFVRDKDGIQAILLYSEMALWYHLKGIPLDIAYENLEKKYGYHATKTISVMFEGQEGLREMTSLMDRLHAHPLKEVAGKKVARLEDYQTSLSLDCQSGEKTPITLEKSNVIRMIFSDSSWIAIRPSGTEPKCKFYVEVYQKDNLGIEQRVDAIFASLKEQLGL